MIARSRAWYDTVPVPTRIVWAAGFASWVIVAAVLGYGLLTPREALSDPYTTCASYQTQRAAQAAYERGHRRLDGDGDGRACESLP